MTNKSFLLAVAAACVAMVGISSAEAARKQVAMAAVTGLAASHDLRVERGRLCFSDHFHYGSSAGQANRKLAEREAVSSWASFVDFEYGGTWTSYAKASSKQMDCSKSGSSWSCSVSARPCR